MRSTVTRFPARGAFSGWWRIFALATLLAGGTAASAVLVAQPAGAVTAGTLTVSTSGSDTGNCQTAACATLGYALSQAAPSDTILVEPGTYKVSADPSGTSNTVPTALSGLTIESDSSAGGSAANTLIDGTGGGWGLAVNADDVTVNGLGFNNTGAAGIFVGPPSSATAPATVSGETIENNVINNSDQCANTPSASTCTADLGAGDYGESMWIMSVTNSTVSGNTLENGLDGGMLLSDEMGPNDGNTIQNNIVVNNALGCGITLAAHNQAAFPAPQPTVGGVYNNVVKGNTSDNNGATGVGLFNGAWNNTIEGNTFNGNGEPAVVLNPTFPVGDVNGNSITGNNIGVNSLLDGPGGGGTPGEHNVHSTQTMGVIVVGAGAPVTGTVIQNNTISGNYYGVYLAALASGTAVSGNTITVTKGGVPVFVAPSPGGGYWLGASDGGVFTFGGAPFEGSTGGMKLNQPVVGMARTPDEGGYWLAAKDGGIFTFGSATYYGSVPGLKINVSNIVGIASTPDGGGYWLVGSDGGVFTFGDAKYQGSVPGLKIKVSNIVGIASTPDGAGYWLVGSDGGVFSFGDAKYQGSVPGLKINVSNIVGIASTPDGGGYWLVGSDGGVFTFGDAKYEGSVPGLKIKVSNIVGIASTPDGGGYWLAGSDGGVFTFGDATFYGSEGGKKLNAPVVGVAAA